MITPIVPPNVSATDLQAVQNAENHNDASIFDRTGVGQAVKDIMLRYFVGRSIRTNEEQNILTDVTILDLNSPRHQTVVGHNEETPHFAASINKLPVTMLVLEELRAGHVTLDTQLTWTTVDQRAGNGVYDQPGAATTGTIRDVLHDMLNRSGNTAVRALVNKVLGGAIAVNNRWAQVPEIPNTRLIPLDGPGERFYLGNTTSKEALWVMQKVLSNQDQYGQYVKQLMQTNIFDTDGVRSQLAGNDYIVLVNKTGLLYDPDGDNFHDVGIIYNTKTHKTYGYAMLTTAPYASTTAPIRANDSLKEMGKYILRWAGDKPQKTQPSTQFAPQTLSQPDKADHGKILY